MSDEKRNDIIDRAINGLVRFCLENKLIVFLVLAGLIGWGLIVMPFDYELPGLPRDPVPVDAIPNVGENQQIVFTEWPGRSPQDVEDQVTYPLTVALLGVPKVKTVRSFSEFGFSSIYVVFEDGPDFYWTRTRLLERLSVAQKSLPEGVTPALGPDATALGQVFWYTLEGRDPKTGEPAGGWDLDELRTIQDWYVRYALQSAQGVSEVASAGGYVREYQVDVDPDALRSYRVTLAEVYDAVRKSNIDVGARTIEINGVEYVIRGRGFLRSNEDLENTVVATRENVPVYLRQVGRVTQGPALRRGALDKAGAEAVGGVVVVRYGENPLAVIKNVRAKIDELAPGLPKKTLADGRVSQVTVVPFYDRTELIHETLDTLQEALTEEIMVTMIVIIVLVSHLRSSMLISFLLPLAVMMAFIAMKLVGVDSNVMSLGGIAIAIGTMVDAGIMLTESIVRHLDKADPEESRREVIYRATTEVARPILTAIVTTLISFLPVFVMSGREGKLFQPLAFTKTFGLLASLVLAVTLIPPLAHLFFTFRPQGRWLRYALAGLVLVGATAVAWWVSPVLAVVLALWGVHLAVRDLLPPRVALWMPRVANGLAVAVVLYVLTKHWMPLGIDKGLVPNLVFVIAVLGSILVCLLVFLRLYEPLLRFFLRFKLLFYVMPTVTVVFGLVVWLGFETIFGFIPSTAARLGVPEARIRETSSWVWAHHHFPGLGREFMPDLDEGSFLLMPVTMPHASIGEALDILRKQDMAIRAVPEVEMVVGKIGRAESALDPAPVSMVETIITYKPEYGPPDPKTGARPRLWREHIRNTDDLWKEIERAARVPGATFASKLQPIAARIIMLESGIRAPMAVRIRGKDLEEIEAVGLAVEKYLKEVPSVSPASVVADRIVGKPYLEIDIDRNAIARYGVSIRDVQDVIETAIGGQQVTTTVEGRERYPVRVRYQRELRDSIESIERILVASADGAQVPLGQVAGIRYVRGPQMIRGEDGQLVGYVLFDKQAGFAEVDVVNACREYLDAKLAAGELVLPAGVERPVFVGNFENEVRSAQTLAWVVPLALLLMFLNIYLEFRSVVKTLIIFAGVFIACSGGFLLIYLYSTDWFLNFWVYGVHMRELFQVHPINMSVAVWVGFIALIGLSDDDGVVMSEFLDQSFAASRPASIGAIREATVEAGMKRIRPCLMTGAATILSLIPVLTSTGRGADVMVPMAIPSVGGIMIALMTLYFTPVTYCLMQEIKLRWRAKK